MNEQKPRWTLCGLVAIAAMLAGCGSRQHDATEAAVNAAEKAVHSARDAADKYAPEQFKGAEDALQTARDELGKKDYAGSLGAAKDAVGKAREAVSLAIAKKEEWSRDWKSLAASVPRTLNEAKARLDTYAKLGRRPPGVSSEDMAEAQVEYDRLKEAWTEAVTASQKGDLAEAMKNSNLLQDGLQKLKDLLGIKN